MKVFILVMMMTTVINTSPLPLNLLAVNASDIQNIIADPGKFVEGLSPDLMSGIKTFGGFGNDDAAQAAIAGFLSSPGAATQISNFITGLVGQPVPRR